ncbi:MAG: hypothetical protein IPH10_05150 [bacterium]|nr:hypothetical protein [bacterium]
MKTGLKVMSLCLLMLLGEQAFAQFNAILAHALPSTPLTTTCGGGTLIPDGWPIKIFMDIDSGRSGLGRSAADGLHRSAILRDAAGRRQFQ